MTPDEISVRQWQELYRAGAFEKDNEQTRELAGWGEVDDPLNNWRMKSKRQIPPRLYKGHKKDRK